MIGPRVRVSPDGNAVVQLDADRWIEVSTTELDLLNVALHSDDVVAEWPEYLGPAS